MLFGFFFKAFFSTECYPEAGMFLKTQARCVGLGKELDTVGERRGVSGLGLGRTLSCPALRRLCCSYTPAWQSVRE